MPTSRLPTWEPFHPHTLINAGVQTPLQHICHPLLFPACVETWGGVIAVAG